MLPLSASYKKGDHDTFYLVGDFLFHLLAMFVNKVNKEETRSVSQLMESYMYMNAHPQFFILRAHPLW